MVMLYLFLVVFFFFKQKTAYEMRISDWSSDVCSSDLADLAGFFLALNRRIGIPAGLREIGVDETTLPAIAAAALGDNAHKTNPRPLQEADYLKIGRASCRERVCQYV